ncbi:MAG: sporulation integral membrane protein YtvI [Clostridia bacterium]|nr:sporulation integral membrane protein YtvI [Clostridia bacterium]
MDKNSKYYLNIMLKFLIFAFISFMIFIAYKVAVFYIPFIIAFIVASIAEPLIKFFMNKCKLNRKFSSVLSLLLILTFIIGSLVLIITSLISEAVSLTNNLNTYITDFYDFGMDLFKDFRSGKFAIPEELLSISDKSFDAILNSAKDIILSALNTIVGTISSVPTLLTNGVITLLAIIFICFDRDYVKKMVKKHVPESWIKKVKEVFSQMCSVSFKYIKAEAKLSGICFLLVLIGLNVMSMIGLDIRYPVLMAILIGFVDLLPLFGAGVVMLPWAVYLFFSGNTIVAICVFALWIVWAVLKQLIEPHFVSKQMGMHPLFTLLGMYTGFKLFGVLGLIFGPIAFLILKNVFSGLFSKGLLKSIFEKE